MSEKCLISTSKPREAVMDQLTMSIQPQACLFSRFVYIFLCKCSWCVVCHYHIVVTDWTILTLAGSQWRFWQWQSTEERSAPLFSGRHRNHDLHTHAPINQLVYHLGQKALFGDNRAHLTLTAAHSNTWLEFTQKAAKEALKKMKMVIPGGKMPKK